MTWEYRDPKQRKTIRIQPEGSIITNNNSLLIHAAKFAESLVWLPQDMLSEQLENGELVTILDDWAIDYTGYYLYYPSRRADSPIFRAFVQAMRRTA